MKMNPCPRGTAMITVIFEVDESGNLTTTHTIAGEGQEAQGNVIAEDVGIELGDGTMSVIIPKGTPYPCSQLKAYTNQSAEQDVFSITVFQGNNKMARQNKKLREYDIKMEPCPKGDARIKITFSYDEQGNFDLSHSVAMKLF